MEDIRASRYFVNDLQKNSESTEEINYQKCVYPLTTTRRILSLIGGLPCSGKSPYWPSLNRKESNVVFNVVLLATITCDIIWTAIRQLQEHNQTDPSIHVARALTIESSFLMTLHSVVFLLWADAPELKQNMKLFEKLQADFKKTTGKTLKNRKQAFEKILSLSTLIGIPIFYYTFAYFVPDIHKDPTVALAILYGNIIGIYVVIYWNIITMIIVDAIEDMQSELKQYLQNSQLTANMIFEFRLLWLLMREVCDSLGRWRSPSLGYALCMGLSVMMFYQGLSMFQINEFSAALGHLVAGCLYVSVIALTCRASQEVQEKMKVLIKEILPNISLSSYDRGIQREIVMLYLVESARPAVTTFGGILIVNRNLILSFFSSISTYLIVLVQFIQNNDSVGI